MTWPIKKRVLYKKASGKKYKKRVRIWLDSMEHRKPDKDLNGQGKGETLVDPSRPDCANTEKG